MGMANPGNNSGNAMFKGSEIEMGTIISAKENTDIVRLKNSSALFFIHFTKAVCTKAITNPAEIFKPMILKVFTIFEKSASVEKK